ncbi:MAG: hypothetical protein KDA37_08905, partial [Planctomycetales bacterium]|nr:hypothetical protein [Planctomycetales bacterium]
MTFRPLDRMLLGSLAALVCVAPLFAAPSARSIFPSDTVLWVSLPSGPDFRQKICHTQLGKLAEDELLAPFADHLRQQLMDRLGDAQASLGVGVDDLLDAAGGELAIGVTHQGGRRATTVVTIDTQGKETEAKLLVGKVGKAMSDRGARVSTRDHQQVTLTVFELPPDPNARVIRENLVRFEAGGLLCFVESLDQAQALVDRLKSQSRDKKLTDVVEFQQTMARCEKASGGAADVVWYVAPFKYDEARSSRQAKSFAPDKKDTLTILREQGFDAIRGIGGHVQVAVDPAKDFVHFTSVYAPPKPGTAGRPAREKYDLGMRMLETPNRTDLNVEKWAPRGAANYSTYSVDVQNAFDNLESVFDALTGAKNALRNTLDGFEKDYFGPKIKVREEVIANLGNRITRMADYTLPVTPDCERYLFVIEAKDPEALQTPVDKLMENDGAVAREVRGVKFWEMLPEEETPTGAQLGGGLLPLDNRPSDEEEEERLLQTAAVCIHEGYLIIASDVEYLEQAVFGVDQQESLAGSYDFQAAMSELESLTPDKSQCSWSFIRTDESLRPTYELLREGRLPEGQTFFARLLNRLLTTSEDQERGIVRKQRVDASKLPTFELARRYFERAIALRAGRVVYDGPCGALDETALAELYGARSRSLE